VSARRGLDTAAVVAAAAELVDADGLDALTLTRVADRVGVRTPSLYSHVAGLGDLQRLLALRTLHELAGALGGATVGVAGDDALRAMAYAYRDFARAHPGRYLAVQRAPEPGDQAHEEAGAAVVGIILAVLRGYGLEGEDALHATRALRSALHGFAILEQAGGFGLPLDLDESFDRLLELLVRGLRR
jgi:AcrR family transcriptional regulator